MMKPIVILGTGLAGYGVAKELRKKGASAPLILITQDDGRFYSKPMLSGALGKGQDADALASASAEKMAQDLDAEVRVHTSVDAIDTAAAEITIGAERIAYASLVLAVGSSPIRPPMQGSGAEDVLSVNNLGDYARFRAALEGTKRVAVIGPGLIGCEFANDLLQIQRDVTLIGPDKWPISALLPEQAGRALQQSMAQAGAQWELETFNGDIEKTADGYRTELKNGHVVEADLILSAVGVRANIGLAKEAGVTVNRGIVTDAQMQTSAPNVYAIGDCAEAHGRNLPFVAPLLLQTKAVAATLTGTPTEVAYPHMPVIIKTTLHPIVTLPPAPGAAGAWQVEGDAEGVLGRFHNEAGEMIGFCVTGNQTAQKSALVKQMAPVGG
ncbi:FAD-dependent oxidoreductase [Magnetofaba australis]|nr:FAD-dependent oxidoreductase [Magnetofaba australis]